MHDQAERGAFQAKGCVHFAGKIVSGSSCCKDSKIVCFPFSPSPGIILSGSPYSVYDSDAPRADPAIFDPAQNDVPVLGICYGLQEMSRFHGAEVKGSDHREYGKAVVTVQRDHTAEESKGGFKVEPHTDQFFEGIEGELPVWSHGVNRSLTH